MNESLKFLPWSDSGEDVSSMPDIVEVVSMKISGFKERLKNKQLNDDDDDDEFLHRFGTCLRLAPCGSIYEGYLGGKPFQE